MHTSCDDEPVPAVLVEHPIGTKAQFGRLRIPDDVVDADTASRDGLAAPSFRMNTLPLVTLDGSIAPVNGTAMRAWMLKPSS
jgi:hypothetical protein